MKQRNIFEMVGRKIWKAYRPYHEVLMIAKSRALIVDTDDFYGEVDFILDIDSFIMKLQRKSGFFDSDKKKIHHIVRISDFFHAREWNKVMSLINSSTDGKWSRSTLSLYRGEVIYRKVEYKKRKYIVGYCNYQRYGTPCLPYLDMNIFYQLNGYERYLENNCFLVIDRNKCITYVSKSFYDITKHGIRQEWAVGTFYESYVDRLYLLGIDVPLIEELKKRVEETLQGESSNSVFSFRVSGTRIQTLVMYAPIFGSDGQVAYAAINVLPMEKHVLLAEGSVNGINVFAHEMREPVNQIYNYTKVIERECHPSDYALMKRIKSIKNLCMHALGVADYMNLYIEDGNLSRHLSNEPVLINNLVQEIYEGYREASKRKGIVLNVEYLQESGYLMIDKVVLRQMLSNIVNNAIKFTEKGSVSIICSEKNGCLEVCIADTGIGICTQYFEEIFQKGFRIPQEKAIDGSGFGLMVVKNLAKTVNAKVRVDSKPNVGSAFFIEFGKINYDMSVFSLESASEKIKVMLVDDADITRLVVAEQLKGLGCEVIAVASGKGAIETLDQKELDLVITDVHLEDIDGYTIAKAVHEKNKNIKVISFSAASEVEVRGKDLEAYFHGYLSKPHTTEQLRSVVYTVCKCNA